MKVESPQKLNEIMSELSSGAGILDPARAHRAMEQVLEDHKIERSEMMQLRSMLPSSDLLVGEERRGAEFLKAFLDSAEARLQKA